MLAREFASLAARPDVVVLALPRGGVPVAFEVARALHAPLDVFVVRKLAVPGHEELAMGAIAPGGIRFVDWETVTALGVTEPQLEQATRREEEQLARRESLFRGGGLRLPLDGRIVILIDDGLATSSMMRVALAALRQDHPSRIAVGIPVAEPFACEDLAAHADDVVCARTPESFSTVSDCYEDFSQTTDDEVCELMRAAASEHGETEFATAPTLAS
jgi:putative phosphoribosyl transferase